MLQAKIADHTGTQWITSFQDSAEVMLGMTANELAAIREHDENRFDEIFADALFKPFILKKRDHFYA